jgi:hypothetical protein
MKISCALYRKIILNLILLKGQQKEMKTSKEETKYHFKMYISKPAR